ncbi:MAG: MFS transporter [Planctomycetota bacterium]|jgi:MFS family permease
MNAPGPKDTGTTDDRPPLPRVFYLLLFLMFTTVIGFALVMPFVAMYLSTERKVSAAYVSVIFLAVAIMRMFGQVIGGESADRFGRKLSIAFPLVFRIIIFTALGVLILVKAPVIYLAVGVVLAMSTGSLIMPSLRAMITDIAPPSRRTEAFGMNRIAINLGWAGGVGLGGVFLTLGYQYLFFASAALCVALLIILSFMPDTRSAEALEAAKKKFSFDEMLSVLKDARFTIFIIVTLVSFLCLGQMTVTFAMYGNSYLGVSKKLISRLFIINGIMVVILQWPFSMAIRRMNPFIPLAVGSALFGVGYFLTGLAGGWWGMLLVIFIVTLGEMLVGPTILTIVSGLAPPDKIGRYMGVSGLAESTGRSLGPVIGASVLGLFVVSGETVEPFTAKAIGIWTIIGAIGIIAAAGYFTLGAILKRKDNPSPAPAPEATNVRDECATRK